MSRYERLHGWVKEHKLLTGAIVAVVGVVAYRSYRSSRFCKKTRRAKRARNGGRLEVVVIAGSPTLPLTRSLSLDFERRGFIVYIVCNAEEDESMVHSLARPDILPLTIDTTDVSKVGIQCRPLLTYRSLPELAPPSTASRSTSNHHMPQYRGRGPTICSSSPSSLSRRSTIKRHPSPLSRPLASQTSSTPTCSTPS